MRQIRQVLPAAMQSDELTRVGKALTYLNRWNEVVGEPLAAKSWPDRYTSGTVWVAVEGAAWANELRMQKETILAKLREMSSDPSMFTNVRFGQRALPPRPEPTPPPVVVQERLDKNTDLSIAEIAARRLAKMRAKKLSESDLPE